MLARLDGDGSLHCRVETSRSYVDDVDGCSLCMYCMRGYLDSRDGHFLDWSGLKWLV